MSFTSLMVDKLWIKIVFHFARGSAAPVDFWFEAAPGDVRPSLTLSFVTGKIARLAVAAVPLESANGSDLAKAEHVQADDLVEP